MRLDELKFDPSPYSKKYARARISTPHGTIVVDKNDNGTYDFWASDKDAIDGTDKASHLQLDPFTAQAVLYHYLGGADAAQ